MTQEEKELLLKDLCSRSPYGVKVNNEILGNFEVYGICENFVFARTEACHVDFDIKKVKPYLFPLSSMTEEQKEELYSKLIELELKEIHHLEVVRFEVEYYLKNHIDYMLLIPMGLAIDATGLNIY